MNGVATWTMVVPVESTQDVAGDADVVTSGIAVAANDVDNPLVAVGHAAEDAGFVPANTGLNCWRSKKGTQILRTTIQPKLAEGRVPRRSAALDDFRNWLIQEAA